MSQIHHHATKQELISGIFSVRDMNQFFTDQGVMTKMYPARSIEEEATMSCEKLIISRRVAGVLPRDGVTPQSLRTAYASSSRLVAHQTSSPRGGEYS